MQDQNTYANLKHFHRPITMPGGYSWDHVKTLNRIDMYYNSRFEKGEYDENNMKRFFFNIVKSSCDIATKFIDLDTKDISIKSVKSDQENRVWFMNRDLRHWMKKEKFAQFLNDLSFFYPIYGSVVTKKVAEGKQKRINLQNLRMDPTVEKLEDSSFVYEVYLMNSREINEMKSWKLEELNMLVNSAPDISHQYIVYECYDQQREGKKWKKTIKAKLCYFADKDGNRFKSAESKLDEVDEFLPSIILFEDELDELPYREGHWEKVVGRWLGLGVVENLLENQHKVNEIVNIRGVNLYYSALKLFWSQDETIGRNVLQDFRSGDIIKTNGINPVPMEDRNLATFAQEEQAWLSNAREKSFSFDVVRGETPPSGTPLGTTKIAANMVVSYFQIKKENLGLFVKEILVEDIIPSFRKSMSKEHVLKLFDSDKEIEQFRDWYTNAVIRKSVLNYAAENNRMPEMAEVMMEKERVKKEIKKNKEFDLDIPKSYYDDLDYNVDIIVTDEQMDTSTILQSLQVVFQIVAGNPTIMQNPMAKNILFKMLDLAGLSPNDLSLIDKAFDESGSMGAMTQGASPVGAVPMSAPSNPQTVPSGGTTQL